MISGEFKAEGSRAGDLESFISNGELNKKNDLKVDGNFMQLKVTLGLGVNLVYVPAFHNRSILASSPS